MDPSSFSLQSFSWLLLQNLHVRKYERILTDCSDSFNYRFTISFNILKERKTGCHGTATAKTWLRQLNYFHGRGSPGDIHHDVFFPFALSSSVEPDACLLIKRLKIEERLPLVTQLPWLHRFHHFLFPPHQPPSALYVLTRLSHSSHVATGITSQGAGFDPGICHHGSPSTGSSTSKHLSGVLWHFFISMWLSVSLFPHEATGFKDRALLFSSLFQLSAWPRAGTDKYWLIEQISEETNIWRRGAMISTMAQAKKKCDGSSGTFLAQQGLAGKRCGFQKSPSPQMYL